ncbi:MAG: hypothetical protein V4643_12930, partial [Bacteroidota bacterium]
MQNIFYTVWVDCILELKKKNKNSWQWKSMLMMVLAMSFNFMFLLVILRKIFPVFNVYDIEIDLFRGAKLNSLVESLILYALP